MTSQANQTTNQTTSQTIGVLGDLLTDVVVRLEGANGEPRVEENIRLGTDTPSSIELRRGGSAANLAVAAARLGSEVVFIGNVGADEKGSQLLADLQKDNVKCAVTRSGRTGTVVALLSPDGERSMLTDRGAAQDFSLKELQAKMEPKEKALLAKLKILHIPGYSLVVEPLGTSALEMVKEMRVRQGTIISVGLSSVGAIQDFGAAKFYELLASADPDYIICNAEEGEFLKSELKGELQSGGLSSPAEKLLTKNWVVTNGGNSTHLYLGNYLAEHRKHIKQEETAEQEGAAETSEVVEVNPPSLKNVRDTTGAGDAFSAGLLFGLAAGREPEEAIGLGHKSAYDLLSAREARDRKEQNQE